MKFCKVLLTLAVVLFVSQAFPALGQSHKGTWIIPPGLPSYVTHGYMDSLNIIPPDPRNPPGNLIGEDSIGKPMFFSRLYVQKNLTKRTTTLYICGEKYWLKLESQVDTISKSTIYQKSTTSLDNTGKEFWTESIDVNVVDSSEIIINSPVDVKARLYEAYDTINPAFEELSVAGSSSNQSYTVNMKHGVTYIIIFVKDGNSVVYAQRIEG